MSTLSFHHSKPDVYWYSNQKEPILDYHNGGTAWEVTGKFHRVDGPAIEYANGTTMWFFHGKLHRDTGPAVEFADGSRSWWLHGTKYHSVPAYCAAKSMAAAEKTIFLLKWAT